jgi:hypothetical protein
VAGALASHALAGDPLELGMNQRHQPAQRLLVAGAPREKKLGDLLGVVLNIAILRR